MNFTLIVFALDVLYPWEISMEVDTHTLSRPGAPQHPIPLSSLLDSLTHFR